MSTARDFSVMPVQCEGEPKAIERAVRSRGSLKAGAYVEVEIRRNLGDRPRAAGTIERAMATMPHPQT